MTAPDPIVTATQLLLQSFDLQTRAERTLRDVREALGQDPEPEALAKLDEAARLAMSDLRQAGQCEREAHTLRDGTDPAERFLDACEALAEIDHGKR
jgi:hypothetical protein